MTTDRELVLQLVEQARQLAGGATGRVDALDARQTRTEEAIVTTRHDLKGAIQAHIVGPYTALSERVVKIETRFGMFVAASGAISGIVGSIVASLVVWALTRATP